MFTGYPVLAMGHLSLVHLRSVERIRKENIPVRVAHKSYMLRQALSHTSTEQLNVNEGHEET